MNTLGAEPGTQPQPYSSPYCYTVHFTLILDQAVLLSYSRQGGNYIASGGVAHRFLLQGYSTEETSVAQADKALQERKVLASIH